MNTAVNSVRSAVARVLHSALAVIVAFFLVPFLVNRLGTRWYGVWVLVSSLSTNYYLFDLGLSAAVSRFVAQRLARNDADGANAVINTSLALYSALGLAIGIVAAFIALFAGHWVNDPTELTSVRLAILIVGLDVALEFPVKAFAGVVASAVRHDLIVRNHLVALALSTALTVALVSWGYGIVALASAGFVANQLSNTLYFFSARRLLPTFRLDRRFVQLSVAREMFGYSVWAFAIQLANQVRFKVDAAVVAGRLSASAVTYYSVGQGLAERVAGLLSRATGFMTPVFTRYWTQGRVDELRDKFLLLTRVNLALGLFGGGVVVVLGRGFIVRWMGPEFVVSYAVLVVLMTALVTDLVGNSADNLLFAAAQHKYLAIINVLEGVANLAISLALAPRFGILGVAIGTAAPLLFFRLFVIPVVVGKVASLGLVKYYVNLAPILAFTVGYLAAYSLVVHRVFDTVTYDGLAFAAISAVPLYAAALPFVGFSREERAYLLAAVRGSLAVRPAEERQP